MLPRRLKSALQQRRRVAPAVAESEEAEDPVAEVSLVLDGLQARVDALAHAVRDLDARLDRHAKELEGSRAAHAGLRDDYRCLLKARERLVRRYRGLAAGDDKAARLPPTPGDMGAAEAYGAYADFVEFCKHVGVRPPEAMPDWQP